VKVDKDNCVATDGQVLGVIPTKNIFSGSFIECLKDKSILIHREDWKKLNGATAIDFMDVEKLTIKAFYNNKRPVIIEAIYDNKEGGKYPNWQGVVPKKEGTTDVMNLIPELLEKLSKALGLAQCKLNHCGDVTKVILVTPLSHQALENEGVYGVIMPISDK